MSSSAALLFHRRLHFFLPSYPAALQFHRRQLARYFSFLFNRRPHSCFRDAEIATTSRAISPESWHCPVFCVEHAPHQTAGSPAEVCVNGCVLSSSGFYGCGSSNSGSASSSSHSIPRDKWRLRWPCSDVRGWG